MKFSSFIAGVALIWTGEFMGLAGSPASDGKIPAGWKSGVLYRGGGFGWEGLIADPGFYMSEVGRHSPRAEWDALMTEDDPELRCKFPFRYSFKKQKKSQIVRRVVARLHLDPPSLQPLSMHPKGELKT